MAGIPEIFKVNTIKDLSKRLRKTVTEAGGMSEQAETIGFLFDNLGVDLDAFTAEMDQSEKDFFMCVMGMWYGCCAEESAYASAFLVLLKEYFIPTAQKKASLQKALTLMGNGILLVPDEAQETFRIMRNIVDDAHYCHHPKTQWPLYDKLALFLGENDIETHNEALRLRDEEEADDEWRTACRCDSETS